MKPSTATRRGERQVGKGRKQHGIMWRKTSMASVAVWAVIVLGSTARADEPVGSNLLERTAPWYSLRDESREADLDLFVQDKNLELPDDIDCGSEKDPHAWYDIANGPYINDNDAQGSRRWMWKGAAAPPARPGST